MKLKVFVVLALVFLLLAGCGNVADDGTKDLPGDEVLNITPEPTPPPNTLPPYVMVDGYLYCISPIDSVELDEDNLLGTITKILPSELPEKDLECNYLSEDTSVYRNPENNMVIYLRNQQERTKKYNYYQGVPLLAKVDGEMYWISFVDSVDINEENLIGTIEVSNTSYGSIPEKNMESNCLREGTRIYRDNENDKVLYFRYYYSDDFYTSYKGEAR